MGRACTQIGRLDQGLLLLTNDDDWAERVLHPRYGVEREYAGALAAPLTVDQARALNAGIRLDEGVGKLLGPIRAAPGADTRDLAATLDPAPDPTLSCYRVALAQGCKRQLRRMFGAIDAPIVRLVRVRIGAVRLGDLRSGAARILKAPEIKGLGAGRNTDPKDARPASGTRTGPRKPSRSGRSRSSAAGRVGGPQSSGGPSRGSAGASTGRAPKRAGPRTNRGPA